MHKRLRLPRPHNLLVLQLTESRGRHELLRLTFAHVFQHSFGSGISIGLDIRALAIDLDGARIVLVDF